MLFEALRLRQQRRWRDAGLQVVNTMEFSVRSVRGWAVSYVVPVPQATRVFADSGAVQDELVGDQVRLLGEEVVRVAEHFARDPALHRQGECDDAAERLFDVTGASG